MAGNKRGFASSGRIRDASAEARRAARAGPWLITRVRQRERLWILRLRFELYVNFAEAGCPEE
ncbi:hypothetical protein GCM10009601_10510 [Streptomyces thermospinosisporus]|uniref:Uncharacterized protein n=1 Tax=Streptomyces thermospinosisporus TaxID=161482 RepID=A0ABN1YL74_9ACTN